MTALSGSLFGALEAGAASMQRDAGVPSVLASVVEASIIVLLISVAELRRAGPVLRVLRLLRTQRPNQSSAQDGP
jgi:ABC-type uncharacterized transport system permease subunit